jgi:ribose 5-phosphate isomerase B
MNIALGSDHAGVEYKKVISDMLRSEGLGVLDFGTMTTDSVDYPDFALAASKCVATNEASFGILLCGSGIGVSITANKVPSIRAANCLTVEMAELSRLHNNANVLTLGTRLVSLDDAILIVRKFLETPFEGGRHSKRVDKIHSLTNC